MSKPKDIALATGVRLQYVEAGAGRPVLMLHGYSDSWLSFDQVLRRLPDGVRGLALTQRGHGGAERPEAGYEIPAFAADAVAFLDAIGVAEAIVVGHSMGSMIAQEIAIAHPERVSRLVLIGSAPRGDNEVIAGLAEAVTELTDPIDRAFVHEFQASTVHTPLPDDVLDAIVDESLQVPARVWRAALAGLRAYDPGDRLAAISAPTAILWGDADTVFGRAEQDELVGRIPGATLEVFAGVGHGVHWEQPERVARRLAAIAAG